MSFELVELDRPQYPSSPEVLLSSLAWSLVRQRTEDGLIYHRKEDRQKAGFVITQTIPSQATLEAFRAALGRNGFKTANGELPASVAEAVANAMMGVQAAKGVGTASSAIGFYGALMQNARGGLSTRNPPNFARLINTMYALGGGANGSATECWLDAARHYSGSASLAGIENALAETALAPHLPKEFSIKGKLSLLDSATPRGVPDWWRKEVIERELGTPFLWFSSSWDRLCSPEWYKVLPPRRWAGWAVCVLRHALAFSFLWEANFYTELAKGVADRNRKSEVAARWALVPTKPLLPYQRGTISQMDVAPTINKLLSTGLACRLAIEEVVNSNTKCKKAKGLPELIEALRGHRSGKFKDELSDALTGGGRRGGLTNLKESVRYALQDRGTPGAADHYSLLRVVSRRFLHVSPGPEWIVVMSGMSASSPRGLVRLGDVKRSLDSLGFQPRLDFLLSELEKAGLSASAPDGDEGIEINLGFGGG